MNVTILGQLAEKGVKVPVLPVQGLAAPLVSSVNSIESNASLGDVLDIREPDFYLAKIEGDSMQGVGILSGDLLIVDRSLYAEHDNIVIASLNSETVCQRLHMRDGVVVLKSENSKYPPRYILAGDDLVILGVVKHSVHAHGRDSEAALS